MVPLSKYSRTETTQRQHQLLLALVKVALAAIQEQANVDIIMAPKLP